MLQLTPRSQDGKVRVYNRATGKHLDRFPVDAREMLTDYPEVYTLEAPNGAAALAPAADPVVEKNPRKPDMMIGTVDESLPDDELTAQFVEEAQDAGYQPEAAGVIAAARLKSLRDGISYDDAYQALQVPGNTGPTGAPLVVGAPGTSSAAAPIKPPTRKSGNKPQ